MYRVFRETVEDSAYRYPRPTPLVRTPHVALHERRINLLPVWIFFAWLSLAPPIRK